MTATSPTPVVAPSSSLPASLRRIVLTGFMGAGKTSTGRLLAGELGWTFLDLDTHLEARGGCSIAALFEQHGEARFRQMESSALAHALAQSQTVIALGGGTPEQLTNRLLLEQTPGTAIVFLSAPFEILYDRCMLQSFAAPEHVRPILASPAEAAARFKSRQALYRRLASLTVAVEDLSPTECTQSILNHFAH